MFKLELEKAEEAEIKLPSVGSLIKQESSRKTSTSALLTMPMPLTVWITTNSGKFLKRSEYKTAWPALLRNLYAGQEATVRTGHGTTTDWFQIGKEVSQVYKLSPYFFNFYADYIMRNAGVDEVQARMKMTGRNIHKIIYTDDTTLVAGKKRY